MRGRLRLLAARRVRGRLIRLMFETKRRGCVTIFALNKVYLRQLGFQHSKGSSEAVNDAADQKPSDQGIS